MNIMTADSPEIIDFLARWDRDDRERFAQRPGGVISYDDYGYSQKTAHTRRKYIACDEGSGTYRQGKYLVERATGKVYTIMGYGVPRHYLGLVHELFAEIEPTASGTRARRQEPVRRDAPADAQ